VAKVKTPKRQVSVVFDTNVLYTDLAHHLLRLEVKTLMLAHSSHVDVQLEWFLPEGVVEERRFQMVRAARTLQKSVQNYSKLLGLTIKCDDEQLAAHVDRCIREELQALGIEVVALKSDGVDWAVVQQQAWQRVPPFVDAKDQEKGFRDSIILETFAQIVDASPTTTIVALVCSDEVLLAAAQERFTGVKNVRLFSDVAEIGGLINTFVENVTEEHAKQITEKCHRLFLDGKNPDKPDSLWKKWNLGELVQSKFKSVDDLEGLEKGKQDSYSLFAPVLVQKNGIRWSWMTRLTKVYSGYDKAVAGDAKVDVAPDLSIDLNEGELLSSGAPNVQTGKKSFADALAAFLGKRVRVTRHVYVRWEIGIQSDGKVRTPQLLGVELGPVTRE